MASQAHQVVFDRWDTYISEADGKPVFISFDVDAAEQDLTATLTLCARVIVPIHQPNASGGPVKPESDLLYELEDELCQLLVEHKVACRLVGRLTHDGIRQLVFHLDDWESFRPPVGLWIMDHEDYAIDVSEHEGWTFFDDCVRPTPEVWQFLADRSVVQELVKAGSDSDKEHSLEFVFNGDQDGLREAARALKLRGYIPLAPLDFASGQIAMVKKMPLDEQAIFEESRAHQALADEHDIEYDGWGAEVVP
jgi:regulator of RNase E activity RraB